MKSRIRRFFTNGRAK